MEQQNPRLILSAILSNHLTDNRLGAEHKLHKIENAFARYIMEPGDSVSFYHQRLRALLSGVQEAYSRAQIGDSIPRSLDGTKIYNGAQFIVVRVQAELSGWIEGLARQPIRRVRGSFEVQAEVWQLRRRGSGERICYERTRWR